MYRAWTSPAARSSFVVNGESKETMLLRLLCSRQIQFWHSGRPFAISEHDIKVDLPICQACRWCTHYPQEARVRKKPFIRMRPQYEAVNLPLCLRATAYFIRSSRSYRTLRDSFWYSTLLAGNTPSMTLYLDRILSRRTHCFVQGSVTDTTPAQRLTCRGQNFCRQ